jgi:hypothetical protein
MAQATIEVTGRDAVDPIAAMEYCYQQGWTDGLPVIPPTEERVTACLAQLDRGRDAVLGMVPERGDGGLPAGIRPRSGGGGGGDAAAPV